MRLMGFIHLERSGAQNMSKNKVKLKGIVSGIEHYCKKSDAKTLKKMAFSIGSKEGSSKTEIRNNILYQSTLLHDLNKIREQKGKLDIMAIDMGIENFAYSRFSWSLDDQTPVLTQWGKIRLGEKFLEPGMKASILQPNVMSELGFNLTKFLTSNSPDAFVIERQRARTMGSANVFEPILKVNILEHVLFSNLEYRLLLERENKYSKQKEYLVKSSDPKRMTDYWCKLVPTKNLLEAKYGRGSPKMELKSTSSTLTKMLKISLVQSLLQDQLTDKKFNKFTLSTDLQEVFGKSLESQNFSFFEALSLDDAAGKNKNDDLADSLLHGLAWLDWIANYQEITRVIKLNSYDEKGLHAFNAYHKQKRIDLETFSRSVITKL